MDSEGKKVELIHLECWKPSILSHSFPSSLVYLMTSQVVLRPG